MCLWDWCPTEQDIEIIPIDSPTWQGWYDPATGFWQHPDHQQYFQYNIVDLPDPFYQEEGTIYWLEICPFISTGSWGWKSSEDHFEDDAVWRGEASGWQWIDLWEPQVATEPLTHNFGVIIDYYGDLVDWYGEPDYFGDGFYFYPWYDWWNIWFYDHPFDPDRYKDIEVILWYWDYFDPYYEMYFDFAVNWSTDLWYYEGIPGEPPLPGVDEDLYIGRELMFSAWEPGGEWWDYYTIPWYNPEWVSADFRGYNFWVEGTIIHNCIAQPQSLDLAFVITGEPGEAPKRPNPEDCARIPPGSGNGWGARCLDDPDPPWCCFDEDCRDESICVLPSDDCPYDYHPYDLAGGPDVGCCTDGSPCSVSLQDCPLGVDPCTPAGVCYAPKTRYISITECPYETGITALRVKLSDGTLLGWVDDPYMSGGICVAQIVAAPVYRAAGAWNCAPGDPGTAYLFPPYYVVNAHTCEIAHASLCPDMITHCRPNLCPGGQTCTNYRYGVQAIWQGTDILNEDNYSEVLWVNTNSTWGDVVSGCGGVCKPPDGAVGLADIMAEIACFQGVAGDPPLTWCDIAPSAGFSCPDQVVSLGDIMSAIFGFQGQPYPGVGPNNCP